MIFGLRDIIAGCCKLFIGMPERVKSECDNDNSLVLNLCNAPIATTEATEESEIPPPSNFAEVEFSKQITFRDAS
jgi:hypothetical protein